MLRTCTQTYGYMSVTRKVPLLSLIDPIQVPSKHPQKPNFIYHLYIFSSNSHLGFFFFFNRVPRFTRDKILHCTLTGPVLPFTLFSQFRLKGREKPV